MADKDAVSELLQSDRKVVQLYRTPGLSDSKTKTLLSKVLPTPSFPFPFLPQKNCPTPTTISTFGANPHQKHRTVMQAECCFTGMLLSVPCNVWSKSGIACLGCGCWICVLQICFLYKTAVIDSPQVALMTLQRHRVQQASCFIQCDLTSCSLLQAAKKLTGSLDGIETELVSKLLMYLYCQVRTCDAKRGNSPVLPPSFGFPTKVRKGCHVLARASTTFDMQHALVAWNDNA